MKYDKIIVELLKRHLKEEEDEIVNLADNGYAIQTDRAVYIIPKEKMVLDAGVFKEGDIDIQSIRVPVDAEVVERTNMLSKVKVDGKKVYAECLIGEHTRTEADEKLLNLMEGGRDGVTLYAKDDSGFVWVEEMGMVTGVLLPLAD